LSADPEFRKRLEQFAGKHGVDVIEKKARAALAAGNNGEAARLRDESLKLMRQGTADIRRELTADSTSHHSGRIQSTINRQGQKQSTPIRTAKWRPY
jgi:hypothetical protein